MKKLGIFILCFIIVIGFLQFYTNKTDFSLKTYINNFETIEKPTLPTLYWDDGTSILEVSQSGQNLNFFQRAGNFFIFIGDCIKYPFEWIAYIVSFITYAFVGVI